MTLREFINNKKSYLSIVLIFFLSIIVKVYLTPLVFNFNYDQEKIADSAFAFFKESKISLVGQELSFQGFFLGPVNFWIYFIPLKACNLSPICMPYFNIAISHLCALLLFLVFKSVFGSKYSLLLAIVYLFSFSIIRSEISTDSNYLIFLSTILVFFCLKKISNGHYKYFYFGSFVSGMAIVNFNPIYIFNYFAFLITVLLLKKIKYRHLLFSLSFLLTPFTPLVIFNLKHENILFKSLINFLKHSSSSINYLDKLYSIIFNNQLRYYSEAIFANSNFLFVLIISLLLIVGFINLYKNRKKLEIFFIFSIASYTIGLTLYSGHVPDYYFKPTLLAVFVLVVYALKRYKKATFIFLFLFLFFNFKSIFDYEPHLNYEFKKTLIRYLTVDNDQNKFNVFFDLPVGENTGYNYLSKISEKIDFNSNNLYFITHSAKVPSMLSYKESFKSRNISIYNDGYLYIVSVK